MTRVLQRWQGLSEAVTISRSHTLAGTKPRKAPRCNAGAGQAVSCLIKFTCDKPSPLRSGWGRKWVSTCCQLLFVLAGRLSLTSGDSSITLYIPQEGVSRHQRVLKRIPALSLVLGEDQEFHGPQGRAGTGQRGRRPRRGIKRLSD